MKTVTNSPSNDNPAGRFDPAETDPGAAALAYAAGGLRVVPLHTPTADGRCSCRRDCNAIGKHPRTRHGLSDATTDPDRIRLWWKMWPDANVGIATGGASGIVVLDVDGEAGAASLAALELRHGPLPVTPTAITGGGGRHLVFRHQDPLRSSAGRLALGLDIRADGGYVVAPPSLHASGRRYVWENRRAPGEVRLAPPPAWLLRLLADQQRPGPAAGGDSDPIVEGARNSTLASLAGAMRRRGCDETTIRAALGAENARRCRPPLPTDEVERIARSVARYAPAPSAAASAGRRLRVRQVEVRRG